MSASDSSSSRLLYCRCAYANVVPEETKEAALRKICERGANFEAVSDLCEMSARRDPRLRELADSSAPLRIVACHPRAVKWLFHAADAALPDDPERVDIVNMRDLSADQVAEALDEPPAAAS